MTHRELCDRLDEFLAGDLVGTPCDEFECHLADCPRCRDEADSYSRIVELLRTADREPGDCPPLLPARVQEAVSRRRSRRRTMAAAAAIVLVAIGGFAWMAGGRFGPVAHPDDPESTASGGKRDPGPAAAPGFPEGIAVVEAPPSARPEPPGQRTAAVTVEFSDDVIGVPIETDDPSVTILWVYPTLGHVAAGD
ncbi:MAG TPA: zf-HC2 domain-containing protein [Planctomycetaceae bacterium]|nr:zf-HC2 domain-containing protein [Planctomycetaceae bacterium]